jgi:hypothetical protein
MARWGSVFGRVLLVRALLLGVSVVRALSENLFAGRRRGAALMENEATLGN